ncbi:MAG: Xylose isomerase domain protein barrel [Candidatus Solibacter sp.]|nr:Xylose isomerase domain protein barrel [Candidatus Solibacter sp.]
MTLTIDRRHFLATAGFALGTAVRGIAQSRRKLKIGHTGITWGFKPEDAAVAIRDVGSLGYSGYETFGEVLEAWEPKGGLKAALDESHLPLISAYCNVNLTDPTKRGAEIARAVLWAKLIQKAGGVTAVIGPNGVKRASYDFAASKGDIVAALNEICKAVSEAGIVPALHQHTGTCIESRDEVYSVLEAVDTRYVKFGPDVGQLAKGGVDPVKVVKDFLPIIRHVHLKDWNGGTHWAEYCPLGEGKVNLPAVLDLLEQAPEMKIIMVELDPSRNPPHTPLETAAISKDFLKKQGYSFRS